MFTVNTKLKTFKWSDLHKKILKIGVAEPNPECLEPLGQVYGMDEKGSTYLLHEWHHSDPNEGSFETTVNLQRQLIAAIEMAKFYGDHERYERVDLPHSFVRAIKEEDAGQKAREFLKLMGVKT